MGQLNVFGGGVGGAPTPYARPGVGNVYRSGLGGDQFFSSNQGINIVWGLAAVVVGSVMLDGYRGRNMIIKELRNTTRPIAKQTSKLLSMVGGN
jgi:hypothetical protein